MREAGCDSATRFSVDEAVADLMLWVEGKEAERKPGKVEGPQPKKGQTWVPKYASVAEILETYGADPDTNEPDYGKLGIDEAEFAEVIESLESDAEAEF